MNNHNVLKSNRCIKTLCLLSILSITGLATLSFANNTIVLSAWVNNPSLHGNTGGLHWVGTVRDPNGEQRRGEADQGKPIFHKAKPRISLFFPIKTTKNFKHNRYRIKTTKTAPKSRKRR